MKLLLDTHAFIWLVEGDQRLSSVVQAVVADPLAEVQFSIASIWEMAIKINNGKLQLTDPIDTYVDRWLNHYKIDILPVQKQHAFAVANLEKHHRDPFDRLIIAQAIDEGATIASGDAKFALYAVPILW